MTTHEPDDAARSSLSDMLARSAREYIPIAVLRTLPSEPLEVGGRERALLQAIRGDDQSARMLFADGGELLDRLYLADLAELAGDRERAIELYLDAVADGARDVAVIGWLLDHATPSIECYFAIDPDAYKTIADACDADPQRAELWQWRGMIDQFAGRDGSGALRRAELLAHGS